MNTTTHLRITKDDVSRLKMAKTFVELKDQDSISQTEMVTLLLDTFYQINGEAIELIKESIREL